MDKQAAQLPRYIRPREWMEITGMSHGLTYRALWSGDLRAVQIGRAWMIPSTEIDAFFARHAAKAA